MKESCTPISSNCIKWAGPNIPCLTLCKGDSITDVVYDFATKYCDLLLKLDPSKYNLSCLVDKACPPKDISQLIQLLIDKICDVEKQEGPQGPAGVDGAAGANGDTIELVTIPFGDVQCPCGGTLVQIYDGEGVLKTQYYLCSGCDGDDGSAGPTGPTGPIGPQGLPGEKGDPGENGICEDCVDTGWHDLLGFGHQVNKPQARRIGNVIHFRGTAVIPLTDGTGQPLVENTNAQNYIESANTSPATIGAGSVDLDTGGGAVRFNNNTNVIPSAVLNMTTNAFDNIYRKDSAIAKRVILMEQNGNPTNLKSTMLSSVLNLIVFTNGRMWVTVLRDGEETLFSAYKSDASFNTSHLNLIVSHVKEGDFVPNYDSPNTKIHSLSTTGTNTAEISAQLTGHSTGPIPALNFKYRFDCNGNDERDLGGFSISLDGLMAYVAP